MAEWYLNVTFNSEKYYFSFDKWKETIKRIYGNCGILYIQAILKKQIFKNQIKKIIK